MQRSRKISTFRTDQTNKHPKKFLLTGLPTPRHRIFNRWRLTWLQPGWCEKHNTVESAKQELWPSLQLPSPLGAASTSEGEFHMSTQADLPYSPSHPGTEGVCAWSFFQSSTTLRDCCCPRNSMWTLLQSGDLTSSRQSQLPTQHELHQPENTSNSVIRDYLIPDKNSLEALKASSAWKPQRAVTALCERQLSLEMGWGTTPLFQFIRIVSGLCKRPPSFHLRNKCNQESNNSVNFTC